jgi:hypothetical protein
MSDPILKGTTQAPSQTKLVQRFQGGGRAREKDLNVIFYQNMPNLHNRYKSVERNISLKNPEYMLYY